AVESLRHRVPDINIDTANNGVEALEKLQVKVYDLVLLDIIMPEMDGYETAQRLRKTEGPNRFTYVIAMTANIYKSDIDKCYECGMNDVVKKPFEIDELISKM